MVLEQRNPNLMVRYLRITDITDDGRLKVHDPVSPNTIEPEYFLNSDD